MTVKVDLGGVGRGGEWLTVNWDDGTVRLSPDIVADISAAGRQLELYFEPNSIDELRCVHTLEHLAYKDWPETLKYWLGFLKPGGKLLIVVPDMGQLIEDYWVGDIDFNVFASVAWHPTFRENKGPGEMHRWGWVDRTLFQDLERAGYVDVGSGTDADYQSHWLYDYEEFQFTGAVGRYWVPNLRMVGRKPSSPGPFPREVEGEKAEEVV